MFDHLSPTDRLALALRLVELPLFRPGLRNDHPRSLARVLHEVFGFDQELCLGAATEACKVKLASGGDVLAALDVLAPIGCALALGVPRFRGDPHALELLRVTDPDVLLVAVARRGAPDDLAWPSVPVASAQELARVLDRESVDTHAHLGGILPPAWFWSLVIGGAVPFSVMSALQSEPRRLSEGQPWVDALTRAIVDRLALADAILTASRASPWPFLSAPICPDGSVRDGQSGRINSLRLRDHMARLVREVRGAGVSPTDFFGRDPLRFGWRHDGPIHPMAPERRFILHALRYVERTPGLPGDVLLRYLRTRNALHLTLTHSPGPEGLLRFSEASRRRKFLAEPLRGSAGRRRRMERYALTLESLRTACALETALVEAFPDDRHLAARPPLRRIELRVSLPRGPLMKRVVAAWLRGVGAFAAGLRARETAPPEVQVGFVVHALRRGAPATAGRSAEREFRALLSFLVWHPEARRYIVGVDIAGNERVAPPRAFAAAYHLVARVQREFSTATRDPPIALGMTLHVGEDFRDVLTGLRHIDEALRVVTPGFEVGLGAGSRIGHGLALGVDPLAFYARRKHRVDLLLATHLLDLCWAWNLCRRHADAAFTSAIEHRVAVLMRAHGAPSRLHAGDLLERAERHLPPLDPRRMGLVELPLAPEEELSERLWPWARGVRVLLDLSPPWNDLVVFMQQRVRVLVADLGVCVEVNPSSNLLVSSAQSLGDLRYEALVEVGAKVSVNTDDPGMFVTSLPREYALLYADMASRGVKPSVIHDWLAARRADGLNSTFLTGRTPSGDALLARLVTQKALAETLRHRAPAQELWSWLADRDLARP